MDGVENTMRLISEIENFDYNNFTNYKYKVLWHKMTNILKDRTIYINDLDFSESPFYRCRFHKENDEIQACYGLVI